MGEHKRRLTIAMTVKDGCRLNAQAAPVEAVAACAIDAVSKTDDGRLRLDFKASARGKDHTIITPRQLMA